MRAGVAAAEATERGAGIECACEPACAGAADHYAHEDAEQPLAGYRDAPHPPRPPIRDYLPPPRSRAPVCIASRLHRSAHPALATDVQVMPVAVWVA